MSSSGHNKKNSHHEVIKKSASPNSLYIKSGTYSSLDIDTSSSENDKLEISISQAKDRIKVYRESQGIGTSEIFSSNSGKSIRTGNNFINTYSSTAQQYIETITSLKAQPSSNTALQHYDRPDFITNTDTPRSLSKPTPYNTHFITSSVVQTANHKSTPNGHATDPTDGTGNPQTISKSPQYNNNLLLKNKPSTDIGRANDIHSRSVEVIAYNKNSVEF